MLILEPPLSELFQHFWPAINDAFGGLENGGEREGDRLLGLLALTAVSLAWLIGY